MATGASVVSGFDLQRGELLYQLVLKDLRVRYKSSFLGYLWALANPLAMAFVYYVAFRVVLHVDTPNYSVFLITGLFPWSWLSAAIIQSAGSYRANQSLVSKVRLPRAILPLSVVLQEMVHFVFACPVLLIAVALATRHVYPAWIAVVPVMIALELCLVYPIALALAGLNVLVRDVEYLVGILLQMLFFLTPIVFPASAIPPQLALWFALNPFTHLIAAWRSALFSGTLPLPDVAAVLAFSAVFAVVAYRVHRRMDLAIGEYL